MSRGKQFSGVSEAQVKLYEDLGATKEEIQSLRAAPVNLAAKMIDKKMADKYPVGAIVELEGKNGLVTAQFQDSSGKWKVSIRWEGEKKTINQSASYWSAARVRPTGETNQEVAGLELLKRRIFGQVYAARRELGKGTVPDLSSYVREKLVSFVLAEIKEKNQDLTDEDLYTIVCRFFEARKK